MEKEFEKLDFVIKQTGDILTAFNGVQRQDVLTFCITMLKRLNFAANGVKVLLDKFNQNTAVEYSIGITMRSVLLDLAIVLNAVEIINLNFDDQEALRRQLLASMEPDTEKEKKVLEFNKASIAKLELFCAKWLSDSANYAINDIEFIYSNAKRDELKTLYANVVKLAPERFEAYNNDGSKPKVKVKNDIKQIQLIKNLRNSKVIHKSATVYDAYSYYSKYDHFGQLYLSLSDMPPIGKLEMMSGSFKAFTNSLLFNLIILNCVIPKNKFLETRVHEVAAYIDTTKIPSPLA